MASNRRVFVDDATKQVTGEDVRLKGSADEQAAQRYQVAEFIKSIHDAGYNPLIIIEMMLAGAAFLGDNYGVSRQQMATVIVEIALSDQRTLIWTP
jgi:hypothetical protein